MATPNVVKVDPPMSVRLNEEEFLFVFWVEEDGHTEPYNVVVSATQAITAGFGSAGPTVEWVRERFLRRATGRLRNDRPILPQLDEWLAQEHPFVVRAD